MRVRIARAYRAARRAAGVSIVTGISRSVTLETRRALDRNHCSAGIMQTGHPIMKKILPYLACAIGIVVLVILVPRFNAAQPQGIRLTRSDAVPIADAQARQIGI